jgi:AGCS family alanine or glycine:cation symporter
VDAVNDFLIFVDGYLGSAIWFPALLLSTGVFFTLYLKFPQIRYFRHAISITTGRFDKSDAAGDTTHFQALATALSGTVGTGNIGGVALALHLGGPAALFWMWVTAFFGMTSKFVEVTLSHKYREKTPDGSMAGGPMYYMEKGLNAKWLAVLFALATVLSSFGTGSLPQINSIAAGLKSTFDIEPIVTACFLSVLLALVIIGGIKRIAMFAAAVVPSMAIIYLIGAFAVILPNLENIIPSFA